jgi:hypothetical protein
MLETVLVLFYTLLFVFILRKWAFFSIEKIPHTWLIITFIVKISAGMLVWFTYHHLYPDRNSGDIFKYFDDGLVLYNALFTHPIHYFKMMVGMQGGELYSMYYEKMSHWTREYNMGLYNENRTMIRFNALCDIFSFGNYHVHTVIICFLSLTGFVGVYKSFCTYFKGKEKALFLILFFIPSALFWSSGVLKEGLAFFALGMCLYFYFKLLHDRFTGVNLVLFCFFFFLLSITKIYVLAALLPSLAAHLILTKNNSKKPALIYLMVLVFIATASAIIPNYYVPCLVADKQGQSITLGKGGTYLLNNQYNRCVHIDVKYNGIIHFLNPSKGYAKIPKGIPYSYWQIEKPHPRTYVTYSTDTLTYHVLFHQPTANSYIEAFVLDGTFLNLLLHTPYAFIMAAFRPHVLEAKGMLMIIAAIENSCVLLFIIGCLLFSSKPIQHKPIFYFCLCSSVLLLVVVGLTCPILGSVVRYKTPLLPFFLMAFLLMADEGKVKKRITK